MRLGQLARKLAVRSAEIVEFLGEKQITINEGANTRLEADHVTLILQRFAPPAGFERDDDAAEAMKHRVMQPAPADETEIAAHATAEPDESSAVEEVLSTDGLSQNHKPVQEGDVSDPNEEAPTTVIKAPKIELSGLKVLGKIDLPEPRKNNPITDSPVDERIPEAVKPKPSPDQRLRGKRDTRTPGQSVIARKRLREDEEQNRKKEEQAVRDKEKRTQSYHNRVKMSPPTKSVRMVDEPLMQMSDEELKEGPRTWFGRLMLWLTKAQ